MGKPWDDHGKGGPWGDPDGDDHGSHEMPPGTTKPGQPAKDNDDDVAGT